MMTNTHLLIKLRELHTELTSINDELESTEQIDDQTIDKLGDLVTEMNQVVDRANGGDATEPTDLMDRIADFETEHPRVTRFLSQLTDMLAMMGI